MNTATKLTILILTIHTIVTHAHTTHTHQPTEVTSTRIEACVPKSNSPLVDLNGYISCIPYLTVPTTTPPPFGHPMATLFTQAATYRNFNSGSYGGAPAMVLGQREAWSQLCELRPDPWMRGGYQAITRQVRAVWADYVNADVDDLVLVESTSSGINAVIRSIPFEENDTILLLNTAYDMVQNTLAYVAKRYSLNVLTVQTDFPVIGNESFTIPVQEAINRQPVNSIKACIFSHITSLPGIILPIDQLAQICKSNGAMVVIDGAHAVGQIPVDITSLASVGVDFYVANGHKWLYGAHGTAMLWTSPAFQADVVPAILSNTNTYVGEFEYVGTRDYTPWAALNATFNFRTWLGEQAILNYIKNLADDGAGYLVALWGVDYAVPLSMSQALTNIGLPTTNLTLCQSLTAAALADYDMYIIPYEYPVGSNVFWIRISTQIYLDMTDYEFLGQAILNYFNLTAAEGGRGSRWEEQRRILQEWNQQREADDSDNISKLM